VLAKNFIGPGPSRNQKTDSPRNFPSNIRLGEARADLSALHRRQKHKATGMTPTGDRGWGHPAPRGLSAWGRLGRALWEALRLGASKLR
jgi:hypothetical protein